MAIINVGLIRVLTVTDQDSLVAQGTVIEKHYSDIKVTSRCIADQPTGIHDDSTEHMAVPKIIALAKDFQQDGMEAVFISCAADPALSQCRRQLRIPVIGAGSSCAALAMSLGEKIGVLGITDTLPRPMKEILGARFVKAIKPPDVHSVLDIMAPGGKEKCIAAALELKQSGCDTIALACCGFSSLGIYEQIHKETGLAVVDPVLAAGAVINAMQTLL